MSGILTSSTFAADIKDNRIAQKDVYFLPPLNTIVLDLFRSHNVAATLEDDWIVFSDSGRRASAAVVQEIPQKSGLLVRIDVRFAIAPGLTIIESFAGIGTDKEKAVLDALQSFAANSLHVLLAAFLDQSSAQVDAEQVTQEAFFIGGRQRLVTAGNIGIRGKPPVQGEALTAWVDHFKTLLGEQDLGPETHWLRLYYAQAQGKSSACEVLLDNEVWDEMQTQMAAFAWPSGEDFYSVRLFLTVGGDDSMLTPKRIVALLAETVEANPDVDEDEIYRTLGAVQVSEAAAHRAFLFTQIAWGRLLLQTLPITFAPDYFWLDAEGNVTESGQLAEEPYFIAATNLGVQSGGTPGFKRLALTSADVHAVNDMYNKGTSAEGARLAPPLLFTEPPTEAGMAKALQFLKDQSAARQTKNRPATEDTTKAPRWQFWKRNAP
ncbi:MAG: DUF6348 family protein [Armatimonadota bacterium]